jgi:nicotinate-nucleotide adenylyltransferase
VPDAVPSTPARGQIRRLGVFGGTFDPPHIGHLVTAVNVRHALDLDLVLLVVAGSPWQKTGVRSISPAADRLAMVRAAVAGSAGIEASSIEVDRSGPSYTIDTLVEMRMAYPSAEFFTIVGADAAALVPTWERYREVLEMTRLVVVDRPGQPSVVPPITDWLRVEIPHLEVSSTDLRERFVDGRPLDFLVPAAVLEVARERGLYRKAVPARGSVA